MGGKNKQIIGGLGIIALYKTIVSRNYSKKNINNNINDLVVHLTSVDAKVYTACWCHACDKQKALFNNTLSSLNVIECSGKCPNSNEDLCTKIKAYPTWEINGKLKSGVKSLNNLARVSGYTGRRNWKY